MNLSPIKYANIESHRGGPIERIERGTRSIGCTTYHLANAWLSERLNLRTASPKIFAAAAGSGVDTHALVARYKAISEAMERWAYHYLTQIGHIRAYGFDIDGSTSGMAAYPGLFRFQARRRAQQEAEERYCVNSWWQGHLDAEQEERNDYRLLKLENPISSRAVVLVWRQYSANHYAYGTAAGKDLAGAIERARIEMEISSHALSRHGTADMDSLRTIENHGERQILYYSLPEGHAEFRSRLEQRPSGGSPTRPQKIIDRIIPGPWQKYATVWRVLYQPGPENSSGRPDFLY